jgi:tetratricopeptide (TPR) repeat protein
LTYQQLAGALEKAGDRAAAEKTLQEAAGRGLATDAMKIELARLLSETGRAAEAMAVLPAEKGAEDASMRDLRGVVLAEAGRLADARAEFVAAVAANPRHASALFHLGMLSLREGDPRSARQWFERSLASRPHSAGTFSGLGLAQSALGDSKGALDSWEKALALDPSLHDTLYNRSVLLGRVGRVAEARKGLEEFLRTAPAERYPREREEARRLLKSLESAPAG